MRDYADSLLNANAFLRRAHDCFLAKNPMGAYHHLMNTLKEVQEMLEYCLEESKDGEDVR